MLLKRRMDPKGYEKIMMLKDHLEERNEQKPEFSFIPVGPRLPPEGESVATPISSHKDGAIPKSYYSFGLMERLR